MKKYELTVLVHPDLEMNLEPAVSKVKNVILDNGGNILKEDNEGKKKLAYRVAGQDFAIYYFFNLELPASAPAKISSVLNITDEVIRYLLVAEDERKIKAEMKNSEEKSENEEKDNAEEE